MHQASKVVAGAIAWGSFALHPGPYLSSEINTVSYAFPDRAAFVHTYGATIKSPLPLMYTSARLKYVQSTVSTLAWKEGPMRACFFIAVVIKINKVVRVLGR